MTVVSPHFQGVYAFQYTIQERPVLDKIQPQIDSLLKQTNTPVTMDDLNQHRLFFQYTDGTGLKVSENSPLKTTVVYTEEDALAFNTAAAHGKAQYHRDNERLFHLSQALQKPIDWLFRLTGGDHKTATETTWVDQVTGAAASVYFLSWRLPLDQAEKRLFKRREAKLQKAFPGLPPKIQQALAAPLSPKSVETALQAGRFNVLNGTIVPAER